MEEIGKSKVDQKVAQISILRANLTNETLKLLCIRISFSIEISTDFVLKVLKQAKALKDSLKFKKVIYKKVQLKKLIKTRNEENEKFSAINCASQNKSKLPICGIMVVKVNLKRN